MAIGICTGLALHHLTIGMALGIIVGAIVGFIHQWVDKKRADSAA